MYQQPEKFASAMMSAAEIVEFLGVSRTTFYRWLRAGIFPPATFAPTKRMKLWSRAAVETWAEEASIGGFLKA